MGTDVSQYKKERPLCQRLEGVQLSRAFHVGALPFSSHVLLPGSVLIGDPSLSGPFCVRSADAHFLQHWGHLSKILIWKYYWNATRSQTRVKFKSHVGTFAYLSHFKSSMCNLAVKVFVLVTPMALETLGLLNFLLVTYGNQFVALCAKQK